MPDKSLGKVSESPTRPGGAPGQQKFDVASLYGEAASTDAPVAGYPLDEKLRQAYFWITNFAIITPFYDIEYLGEKSSHYELGDSHSQLHFPSQQSYSSFVLLPLLNLVVRRRCLLVGGPGRGKTASATLMGLLAGYSGQEIKRTIQHGQPQMTITDLLGNPLPADLMNAQDMGSIRISWRKWLSMRVKIIDEYNRIPTRTQSALLTVMGDNYAEILDQVYECPEAAWYLTANDDSGGGTYQVIEALRDRIDIVVKALHFNTRFIPKLLYNIENNIKAQEMIPPEIIFTEAEIDRVHDQILAVNIPLRLMRRLEYFISQFEFFESGGEQFEYKTKDNIKLASLDINQLLQQESGKDQQKDIGNQTHNGVSVRSLMTLITFIKAMAFFRGNGEADFEDVRNILPFVLHDKLVQNSQSPWFDMADHQVYKVDRVSWIRQLFDLSCTEFERLNLDKQDLIQTLLDQFDQGLEGLSEPDTLKRMVEIEKLMESMASDKKLYGPRFDDILTLKYLHQRYNNYLQWLKWKK